MRPPSQLYRNWLTFPKNNLEELDWISGRHFIFVIVFRQKTKPILRTAWQSKAHSCLFGKLLRYIFKCCFSLLGDLREITVYAVQCWRKRFHIWRLEVVMKVGLGALIKLYQYHCRQWSTKTKKHYKNLLKTTYYGHLNNCYKCYRWCALL